MKGICICKQCINDLRNGTPIQNIEKFDPDSTLRNILKYCVPYLNLHNTKNVSLCFPCVEVLKSLEDHVKRYTNLEDIHDGRIPEDIGDFVQHCMRSFTISSDSQLLLNNENTESKATKKVKNPRVFKLKKARKRVKRANVKGLPKKRIVRNLKRTVSLDSSLDKNHKQKIPMMCNNYLNSMLEKSNSDQQRRSPSSYSELFL